MSHSTVIVTGEDVERALAPFNEDLPECAEPKWDWYAVGGRWRGFFRLTPEAAKAHGRELVGVPGTGEYLAIRDGKGENENYEGKADTCLKSEIDFRAMRTEAEHEADLLYDAFEALVPADLLVGFELWSSFLAHVDAGALTIHRARELYREQPANMALRQASKDSPLYWESADQFAIGRVAYVRRAGQQVAVPFAILHDGEWHERGQMGWFGMAFNEKDENAWASEVITFWEMLPEDTQVTLIDVHI